MSCTAILNRASLDVWKSLISVIFPWLFSHTIGSASWQSHWCLMSAWKYCRSLQCACFLSFFHLSTSWRRSGLKCHCLWILRSWVWKNHSESGLPPQHSWIPLRLSRKSSYLPEHFSQVLQALSTLWSPGSKDQGSPKSHPRVCFGSTLRGCRWFCSLCSWPSRGGLVRLAS